MNEWVLVGLPNVGKSTLFNKLTQSKTHVGNWSGVTVKELASDIMVGSTLTRVVDLPGMYGVVPYSDEEKVTADYLLSRPNCTILNVVSVFDLNRGIAQTIALKELGFRVMVVLTFWQKGKKDGIDVDASKLSIDLRCPVVIANTQGQNDLINLINQSVSTSTSKPNSCLPQELAQQLTNETIPERYKTYLAWQERENNLDKLYSSIYSKVNLVLSNCVIHKEKKIKILPLWRIILQFVMIVGLGFWVIFGPIGNSIKSGLDWILESLFGKAFIGLEKLGTPMWIRQFVDEVIFSGLGSVLGFLPQIALLFLFVELIEQSGILSQFVWLFMPLCHKFGISGKSIFPLLMGAGCNTTAIPLTSSIKNTTHKHRTIYLLPYMPCSAKLPVLALISGAFFGNWAFLVSVGLYILSIVVGVFSIGLLPKASTFDIWEYNRLQKPSTKVIFTNVVKDSAHFLNKIWKVLLVYAILIWFGIHFSVSFSYMLELSTDSILSVFSTFISPLFAPLGLNWAAVCALILGMPAKELTLLSLAMINGVEAADLSSSLAFGVLNFDISSALSFLCFFMLYTPCISSIAQIKLNTNSKFTLWLLFTQLVIAYLVSWFVYSCARCVQSCGISALVWTLLMGVIVFSIFVKFYKKRQRCKNCPYCSCGR